MALKNRCLCSHPQSYDHTIFHWQSPHKPTCACLFLGSEHVLGRGCSPETNTRGTCCFSPRQLFITRDSGQEWAPGHSWEHGLSRWGQFSWFGIWLLRFLKVFSEAAGLVSWPEQQRALRGWRYQGELGRGMLNDAYAFIIGNGLFCTQFQDTTPGKHR